MTYRRERSVREVYEERFMGDRPGRGHYSRGGERRGHFGRPDGYEYEGGPRFFPNGGGPRNYHGEDQRGYHGDSSHFPPSERRGGPPSRRQEDYFRGPREEQHTGRPMEYNNRAPPTRNQSMYPAPRALPESGSDTLMQAILNLDRGDERQDYRRKAPPFPPPRDRSPHSRSGSSVSSRGYSPERTKNLPFPSQQGKSTEKIPGLSREGSPSSATSTKEENNAHETEKDKEKEKEEPLLAAVVTEESQKTDDFKERRSLAIATKAQEIEKVYRQDCETFGTVVKMLVAKDPNLEKQLQVPLRENLGEIRERCLEDLKQFISQLDETLQHPELPTCDLTAPSATSSSQKLSKTGSNHS
ncbi:periphilin-1 isoform X1 [Syngnathus scovelli]|uniref:periphilin-1 isoform X1 n=1 Tax=Syngnathus scovelli TaxID=161590 RepID=UPI00210FB324|nr:periphilin-1 isoform X1 [Syngnathus scovelli]XP_049617444.1 periphilin-1 isoform X1 [Syngnathus scovelli]XP_049617445.1 periphilin-1 isoform X1 [Syngnathus scovelli]XP_049617446.1 periphilin-1 isoform X1 [Syngnathus scovelli]